ncbi:MAG: DNA gyrase inhibitor YacG [Alphaproteobacteria bacterium]
MAGSNGSVVPLRPTRSCPICCQSSGRRYYPFCSQRCADRDLNRWLLGAYTIPVVTDDYDDGDVADEVGGSE